MQNTKSKNEKIKSSVPKDIHKESGLKAYGAHVYVLADAYIAARTKSGIPTFIVGIQGAIGIGKTTLAANLKDVLESRGYQVAAFSIDDFYCSLNERRKFASKFPENPFYKLVRGMPGTHRIDELKESLDRASCGKSFSVPHFDKSLFAGQGDVTNTVTTHESRKDFLILEGWCVHLPHITKDEFVSVVRTDEYVHSILKEIDSSYHHIGEVLEATYAYGKVWQLINEKTFLHPVNTRYVEDWRAAQEAHMIKTTGSGLTEDEVRVFARHFVPFSYFMSKKMRNIQNAHTLDVSADHTMTVIEGII